jgi:hypothetical protein
LWILDRHDRLLHRTGQTIEFPNGERIARSHVLKSGGQLGTIDLGPRRLLDKDLPAAGRDDRVKLKFGILVRRGDAGIAKLASVISTSALIRPHQAAPANRTAAIESHMIPMIQAVPGWTLNSE